MATKNVFAGIGADDSDDEIDQKPKTKTQKKKEERKVNEAADVAASKPVKINESKMQEGGFEISNQQAKGGRRPQTGRGRGGNDGGFRGRGDGQGRGRGGRGGGEGRPGTGKRDAIGEGAQMFDTQKKQGGRFQGQNRDAHQFDRQSGMGRGIKPQDKKGGAGKGNWGMDANRAHKQGHEEEVPQGSVPTKIGAAKEDKPAPKKKAEEEKAADPEPETEEVILGQGLDDYLKTTNKKKRARAREAEGIKGAKVEASDGAKDEKAATVGKKGLAVGAKAGGHELLGFVAAGDDDEAGDRGARRGGRGGRGRGGREEQRANQSKRGDAKKQFKRMSEEDFPAL